MAELSVKDEKGSSMELMTSHSTLVSGLVLHGVDFLGIQEIFSHYYDKKYLDYLYP